MEKNQKTYSQHEMADMFIKIANDLIDKESTEKVNAALMFASARFSAFDAASKSEDLRQNKADALEWFTNEYKRMLDANLDEYIDLLGKSNFR